MKLSSLVTWSALGTAVLVVGQVTGGLAQAGALAPSAVAAAAASTTLTVTASSTQQNANHNARRDAGDTVTFRFVVTNSGGTDVTGLVVASGGVNATCSTTSLAAGATTACSVVVPITQADMDRGSITRTGTATAAATGATVTPGSATTTAKLTQVRTLSARQQVTVLSGGTPVRPGQHLLYRVTVTNTGTVTARSVRVLDGVLARTHNSLPCAATVLAPGASTTCTSSPYTVTTTNGANGTVRNWATAWATIAGSAIRSQVTETVVQARPAVKRVVAKRPATVHHAVKKAPRARIHLSQWLSRVLDRGGNGRLDVGDGYVYSFKVKNTGALSVSSVRIHDRRVERAGGSITCGRTHLAPGQSTICSSTVLSVSRFQVRNGLGTNYANATAVSSTGRIVRSNASSSTHGLSATADAGSDPAAARSLPRTGSDPLGLLALGGGLLLVGGGLSRWSRRRDDGEPDEPTA